MSRVGGWSERLKRRLQELRMADERKKRRWMVGATGLSMVLILTAWVGYMNAEIRPLVGSEETNGAVSTTAVSDAASPHGPVKTFERGVSRIVEWVGSEISYVMNGVKKTFGGKNYEYQLNGGKED